MYDIGVVVLEPRIIPNLTSILRQMPRRSLLGLIGSIDVGRDFTRYDRTRQGMNISLFLGFRTPNLVLALHTPKVI